MNEILVVDDDAALRQVMQWALEDSGYAVASARDGKEAIARIAQSAPRLLVLDAGLPGVDGFGVAAELRRMHDAAVPIVLVTADGGAAEKAARVGARAFLRKPFEMRELVAAVQRCLIPPAFDR
jgi:DNA-binding response OmpR family regulator